MRNNIRDHVMNYSLDMLCTIDAAGRFIQVSEACRRILGYGREKLEGQLAIDYVCHEDKAVTLENFSSVKAGDTNKQFENSVIGRNGQQVYLLWSVVWLDEDNYFFCVVRDISANKLAEKEIRRKEAVQRVLIDHGSDMQALLDAQGNYIYVAVAESYERAFGYKPDQIAGTNAFSLIHPDDIARVEQAFGLLHQTKELIRISDIRFRTSNGGYRWVETTASNQLENPNVQAIVVSSRDITEIKQVQFRLQESEQRFKSLFENNPDIVLYQNEEGTILDANPAFLSFVGKQKEEVVNKLLFYFLPSEVEPLLRQKLREAFSGQAVSFEAEMTFEEAGYKVLSVVKVPLKVEGNILGVHAVMRDITEMTLANKTIQQQAKKLSTIFESITDAFFTLDRNWKFTYTNPEFDKVLGVDSSTFIGECIWDIYPEETYKIFYKEYHRAIETRSSAHFQAYLERLNKWLEVKAFPSEEGLSVYFNDITEQIHQKQELEKLSLVASLTTNSVIITNAQGLTEWVNEGFTKVTGYTLPEIEGRKPGDLLQGAETDPETVKRISRLLKTGKPFSDEILNYRKSGEKLWGLMEITPVFDEAGVLSRFIAILNDVTERKRKEEELKKLSLVASKTSNSVIIMNDQRLAEWVNEGFTRMTGYTLEEIVGKNPMELLSGPDTDPTEMSRISEKLTEGIPFNSNIISYQKSGDPFWLAMDLSPVYDEKGKITHIIAIQKDVTFRKEAEANLVKMSQTLYRQNKDLEQFTYIVSHNLRSPVANVLGLSDLMTRTDKESELFEASLSNLKLSAQRLDTVLRDLNTILCIRDSKGNMELEEIDVKQKIQQALTSLQDRLESCGGIVTIEIREGLCLWANKAYLYSIFYNLLSNAIKYRSRERALRVEIKCLSDSKEGVTISFTDNGLGFDLKRAKDKVFKLYQRFHPEIEGKGIGLFLVKTHLEAMGGHIDVKSEPGEGTSFLLYLPKTIHENIHN